LAQETKEILEAGVNMAILDHSIESPQNEGSYNRKEEHSIPEDDENWDPHSHPKVYELLQQLRILALFSSEFGFCITGANYFFFQMFECKT
jgi:hypothetical protein